MMKSIYSEYYSLRLLEYMMISSVLRLTWFKDSKLVELLRFL